MFLSLDLHQSEQESIKFQFTRLPFSTADWAGLARR